MLKAQHLIILVTNAALAAGCSGKTSNSGSGCNNNAGCAAGEICRGDTCQTLRASDRDCDHSEVCSGGSRPEPTITNIDSRQFT